jgi:hypothetical protein
MVLAFYYIWYRPERWQSATFTPIEFYNSTDPKTVRRHCEEAKRAGIDGFIISFWGMHELEKLDSVVRVLDGCGLKYTVYIEVSRSAKDLIRQIDTVLKFFGERRNFLRINKKPTIFIYGRVINSLSVFQMDSALKSFPGILMFADGGGQTLNLLFKNLHRYIVLDADEGFYENFCDGVFGYCAVPVFPGFKYKEKKDPYVPYENGKFYEHLLNLAIKSKADILLITSFNEWWEGTNVEPSREFGDLFLRITREYSEIFKKTRRKKGRENLKLPKFNVRACYIQNPTDFTPFLFREFRILESPQKIEGCDLVVYGGNERYDTAWNPYLMDYLRKGKMLISGGPFPFYYDKDGKYVNFAHRFGLKMRVVDDNTLRGKFSAVFIDGKDTLRFYPWGEDRIRDLLEWDEDFYRLRVCKDKCEDFVIGGRVGNIYYVWRGLVESKYGINAVIKVLRRMGF